MSLGYNVYEDDRNFNQDGLTGQVNKYATENMSFPCYIIVADDEHKVQMYRIVILKQMSSTVQIYDEEESKLAINIYFYQDGKTVSICKIFPKQVKSFLKLFDECKVIGFMDKDTELNNNLLYVLSN